MQRRRRERIVGAIDGIGMKKRTTLLNDCKSIEGLVNMNEGDLIKLMGEKLGKHIFSILRYKVI